MDSDYCKRFRMEIDLSRSFVPSASLPIGYHLVPWNEALLDAHARTKYEAFCKEIDAQVFPCLGDLSGCRRLMHEIRRKPGFLPEATWLIARNVHSFGEHDETPLAPLEWCGTIQGVLDCSGVGSIQNIGIVPSQRGSGLGSVLIEHALSGFQNAGAYRVTLEVTAENIAAIRLYQRLGFQRTKTIYKPVDSTFLTDGGHSSTSPLPLGFPASRMRHNNESIGTNKNQQDLIATMVSAVVEERVVAESPQDVADSGDADLQLLPSGASKPLISTSSM